MSSELNPRQMHAVRMAVEELRSALTVNGRQPSNAVLGKTLKIGSENTRRARHDTVGFEVAAKIAEYFDTTIDQLTEKYADTFAETVEGPGRAERPPATPSPMTGSRSAPERVVALLVDLGHSMDKVDLVLRALTLVASDKAWSEMDWISAARSVLKQETPAPPSATEIRLKTAKG